MTMKDDMQLLGVEVNADASVAALLLPADLPRNLVTQAACRMALAEKEVQYTQEVRQAVDAFMAHLPPLGQAQRQVVARAVPPLHGVDASIQWNVQEPGQDSQDTSFYERRSYVKVLKDQVLGKLIPHTMGTDGRDVRGKTLACKPGRPISTKLNESILVDSKNQLIAQISGQLIRDVDKASVIQLLEVADYVDFSTGHIEFDGDVHVRKGVRDHFKVNATGNVEIDGLVEAAEIHAGGDLILNRGAAGRDQSLLHADGELHANYLHAVRVECGKALRVQKEMNNANLMIHGDVASPHATMIGGEMHASGTVEIEVLGSPAGTRTNVRLGCQPHDEHLFNQLTELTTPLSSACQTLRHELDALLTKAGHLTPAQKERQTELLFELDRMEGKLRIAQSVQNNLHMRMAATRRVDLKVHRTLHHGTVLSVGRYCWRINKDQKGPLHITLGQGSELYFKRESAPAQPLSDIAAMQSQTSQLNMAS